jgi:glycosyltransferase involved in cell wall biosynthesis
LYPDADLHTLIHIPGAGDATIEKMRIVPGPLSRLPGVGRYYRWLLPLMPAVIGSLDLRDYDLVISLSHCVAKGARVDPSAAHVCYCFTPMRYVWVDVGDEGRSGLGEWGLKLAAPLLRAWDRRSAGGVDQFMANSANVARRIEACYGRSAEVVYSPVDTDFYTPSPVSPREDWYLVVSALTPYKRVEHAIEACGKTGRRLKVIGTGPQKLKLQEIADGYAGVEMLGWRSDDEVRDAYRHCRALLMPQEEDFGLVPLEAAACGTPTIAYAAGGALETLVDGETGVLYGSQSISGLLEGIERFEERGVAGTTDMLRARAEGFGVDGFCKRFTDIVVRTLASKGRTL